MGYILIGTPAAVQQVYFFFLSLSLFALNQKEIEELLTQRFPPTFFCSKVENKITIIWCCVVTFCFGSR